MLKKHVVKINHQILFNCSLYKLYNLYKENTNLFYIFAYNAGKLRFLSINIKILS